MEYELVLKHPETEPSPFNSAATETKCKAMYEKLHRNPSKNRPCSILQTQMQLTRSASTKVHSMHGAFQSKPNENSISSIKRMSEKREKIEHNKRSVDVLLICEAHRKKRT